MFIVYEKISVATFKKIYNTKNTLNSPALSLDRIAIVYNKFDEILISPIDKKQFLMK